MTLWLHFTVDAITADELTVALNRRPCEVISIVREGANSRYVAFCRQRLAGEPPRSGRAGEGAIDWSKPIETDEDVPRHARVVGETKSTLDYFVVRIDSRKDKYDSSYHHPDGEYRALKSNGFIRGNLSVRNEASIDRRAPADQISADRRLKSQPAKRARA